MWDQNGRNKGSWIEIEVNDDGGVMLPSGMEIKVISIPRVDIGGTNIRGGGDIGENNGGGINEGSPCRNRRNDGPCGRWMVGTSRVAFPLSRTSRGRRSSFHGSLLLWGVAF